MGEAIARGIPKGSESANVRTIMAGAFGNLVEWYDWTIYGLLAATFSRQIFPADKPITSVIAALITFAVGFLLRPVGSIVLSPLADKYGRRRVLGLTIIMIGVGSLIVAVTPSYATAGIFSPIMLLFARLLQGFSAGGEFQGSTVYIAEHAPADRRGLYSSSQLCSIGIAVLLATAVAALTTAMIPQPALGQWGWRLPFLLGAILSLYGFYIRWNMPETPAFINVEAQGTIEKSPALTAFRDYPWETFFVFAIQSTTVMFYLWTVFLPSYANLAGGLPAEQGFIGGTIAVAVFAAAVPFWAYVSDKVGRRPVLIGGAIGFFVLAYPMFGALETGSFRSFLLVAVAGCILIGMVDGVMAAVFSELFPARVRTSGIGVPYAVCSAILGGTAPLLAAWFIKFGHSIWIAYYVMAISLFAAISCWAMPETRGRPLD